MATDVIVTLAADGTPRRLSLSRAGIDSVAALVNHGLAEIRVRPTLGYKHAALAASVRLGPQTWLNLHATAIAKNSGFPAVQLSLGAIRVPAPVVRLGFDAIRQWSQTRGVPLPPLDMLIRNFGIDRSGMAATVAVPHRLVVLLREVAGESRNRVDPERVRRAYARLLAAQITAPSQDFAEQLRRAFGGLSDDPVADNRSAFIALAMFTVDPRARRLAEPLGLMPPCLPEPPTLFLTGRSDLSKHWALSAAMAAALDASFTRAIGEWKELDDSLPGGSGFSFIDLSADRSGTRAGRMATDPVTAAAMRTRLARTSASDLLPPGALGLTEGLSRTRFVASYGSLDSASYAETVRHIDALLDRLPLFRG